MTNPESRSQNLVSEVHWQRDPFLMLVTGLLLSLLAGTLVVAAVGQFAPSLPGDHARFVSFLVNTLSLHGATLLLTHLFLRFHGIRWRDFFGLAQPSTWRHTWIGLLGGVLSVPLLLGLNKAAYELLRLLHVEPVQQQVVQIAQDSVNVPRRVVFALCALLLAPVAEEILFRGIIYPFIRQRGYPLLALFGSAGLFAVIHSNLMTFVPLFVFALGLAWLVAKTGNLLAPILAHAFFNGVNFLILINQPHLDQWLAPTR